MKGPSILRLLDISQDNTEIRGQSPRSGRVSWEG